MDFGDEGDVGGGLLLDAVREGTKIVEGECRGGEGEELGFVSKGACAPWEEGYGFAEGERADLDVVGEVGGGVVEDAEEGGTSGGGSCSGGGRWW